jgi:hypothetical protein
MNEREGGLSLIERAALSNRNDAGLARQVTAFPPLVECPDCTKGEAYTGRHAGRPVGEPFHWEPAAGSKGPQSVRRLPYGAPLSV